MNNSSAAVDQRPRAAIVYDFDGTLSPGNIQEHSFLPNLKIDPSTFWTEVKTLAKQHDADEILVYMWRMLEQARAKGSPITRQTLHAHGEATPLFDGLDSWFDRINAHPDSYGLQLSHFVVSSGILEILKGCRIFSQFRRVYASSFIYDERGEAAWPGIAINYTTKTQFLFRINKGIENSWDAAAINTWQAPLLRPFPFSRMIFIGDGDTDIPSMKMVRHQGGQAVAVFDPKKWEEKSTRDKLYKLIAEDRATFVAPADYSEGSQIEIIVKGSLGRFAQQPR